MGKVARYKPRGRPFKAGEKQPGSGRRKGIPNRIPMLIKDAVAGAMEDLGELIPIYGTRWEGTGKQRKRVTDTNKVIGWKKGPGGTRGYMRHLGKYEPTALAGLASRILPMQVNVNTRNNEDTVTTKFKFTPQELKAMPLEEKLAIMKEMIGLTRPLAPALPKPQESISQQVIEGEFSPVQRAAE